MIRSPPRPSLSGVATTTTGSVTAGTATTRANLESSAGGTSSVRSRTEGAAWAGPDFAAGANAGTLPPPPPPLWVAISAESTKDEAPLISKLAITYLGNRRQQQVSRFANHVPPNEQNHQHHDNTSHTDGILPYHRGPMFSGAG